MTIPLTQTRSAILAGFLLTTFLLIICILAPRYFDLATGLHLTEPVVFFISRILFWLSLGVIFLYTVKIEKQPFLLWDGKDYKILFYLASVAGMLLAIIAGGIIIGLSIHFMGLGNKSNAINAMLKFSFPLKLFTIITAAVGEELLFRGYLMSRLQLFFKSRNWPVIISALVFGLVHFRYGTVINVVIPIFIGFVFAWHYQKYRNLKVLMICHFLIDFYALVVQK